jgi:excisionase family DNA binding protein
MDKLLLTPPEAAMMLGIGRTKLYDLLKTNALDSIRIGGSRRIPRTAVEDFVARVTGAEMHRYDGSGDADEGRGIASGEAPAG